MVTEHLESTVLQIEVAIEGKKLHLKSENAIETG